MRSALQVQQLPSVTATALQEGAAEAPPVAVGAPASAAPAADWAPAPPPAPTSGQQQQPMVAAARTLAAAPPAPAQQKRTVAAADGVTNRKRANAGSADDSYACYLAAVEAIPVGETRTFTEVAQAAGKAAGCARMVGKALRRLDLQATQVVPWWRVVAANGSLHALGPHLASVQLQKLVNEGVRPDAGAGRDVMPSRHGDGSRQPCPPCQQALAAAGSPAHHAHVPRVAGQGVAQWAARAGCHVCGMYEFKGGLRAPGLHANHRPACSALQPRQGGLLQPPAALLRLRHMLEDWRACRHCCAPGVNWVESRAS